MRETGQEWARRVALMDRINQLIIGVERGIGEAIDDGDQYDGDPETDELGGLLTELLCARMKASGALVIQESRAHGFTASIALESGGERLGAIEGHGTTRWRAALNVATLSGAWGQE